MTELNDGGEIFLKLLGIVVLFGFGYAGLKGCRSINNPNKQRTSRFVNQGELAQPIETHDKVDEGDG